MINAPRCSPPRNDIAHITCACSDRSRGTAKPASNIVMLVDPLPGATLFDLGALQVELEELLGARVDPLTPDDLPASFRGTGLSEAIAL